MGFRCELFLCPRSASQLGSVSLCVCVFLDKSISFNLVVVASVRRLYDDVSPNIHILRWRVCRLM